MSITGWVRGKLRESRGASEKQALLQQGAPEEILRADWAASLSDPTAFYEKCFRYFHTRLPAELQAHRKYFTEGKRGFGEDAFHVMWFLLFREFQPRTLLEIGVYRGQTISLASMLQRHFGCVGEVVAISPFSSAGDSVTKYIDTVDFQEDTLKNFAHFSLPKPNLVKAYSTDESAKKVIASKVWDCVYIDGNHDYEIALQDWQNTSPRVRPGGIIVLDDSGLSTSFRPPNFATGGHPGPSRLAGELKQDAGFEEILQVGHNRVFQKRAQA